MMLRRTLLTICICLVCLAGSRVQATTIIEFPLDEPFQYERSIGPFNFTAASDVNIYVQNVYDPARWKEWLIKIWVPNTAPDLTTMNVDYDNTPNRSAPLEIFPVTLAPILGPPPWPGFKGFYADTWDPQWAQYGTTPVGTGGEHPWGNPAWVSFHFTVPEGPFGVYIYDECIPEPATLIVLLAGLLLFAWKRKYKDKSRSVAP